MISAVGTNSDTKGGKEFGIFDQCLGEKRENYLENSAQQMPSLLTLGHQSGSGPGSKAQVQIMAGLGEQCRLEHLIPPGLP